MQMSNKNAKIRNKKSPKVVISGYYGFDNCGDEAVLLAIVHCLRELLPDIRITVLSGNPQKTRELYAVEACDRWNPLKVAFEIISCRVFISGGGSLLQDVTSARSLRYYLALIRLASVFRKRIMIYSQGIGPLTASKSRTGVFKALNRCHTITVRDEHSAELLRELGIKHDIHVTCDPVMAFSRDDIDVSEIKDELNDIGVIDRSGEKQKPLLVAAVRQWGDNSHIPPIAKLLDIQARNGWDVLLVPAHYPNDMESLNEIANLMTEQPYILDKCLTASQFLALTVLASRVFSMRLHGLVCAFATGAPMLGLSYDPKVDAFMEQAGLSEYCLPFDSFNCNAAECILAQMDELPQQPQQIFEARRQEMQGKAWKTAQAVIDLLDVAVRGGKERL